LYCITKQAKYVSPPKRIVTRKRKANPDKWQKNVRKRLRQAGSEYIDTKRKTVEAKEMKDNQYTHFQLVSVSFLHSSAIYQD
jgi:hypothetical protein